jgi:sporulation protein YlmC with PRC-barrel domain
MEKVRGRDMVGKTIVSEESGRKFGIVGDVNFISESGELMNLVIAQPTQQTSDLQLQQDDNGRYLVPFSAVKSVGDFIIVSERSIV